MSDGVTIREATAADWPAIWALFREVTAAGDAFTYDADTPEEVARKLWAEPPAVAFVAELGGRVVGTYYVRPNQPGRGSHVANAAYAVAQRAQGLGVGRALAEHSLEEARRLGYTAMQFNFVVSTNAAAVELWKRLGFTIVGTLPHAFQHPSLGMVDAYVMYRFL